VAPSDTRAKMGPTASTSVVCALGFDDNEDGLCAVPYQAKFRGYGANARNQWLALAVESPRDGGSPPMWKSVLAEAREVVWLASVVGGLSAVGVGIALALAAG